VPPDSTSPPHTPSFAGAEQTGCNQATTSATSTCQGTSCAVTSGEQLRWGDSTCSQTSWHAARIVGAPDFYPRYGDTDLGWDPSTENAGHEFIELRFGSSVYVTGFE
jgi:hypothetical protein